MLRASSQLSFLSAAAMAGLLLAAAPAGAGQPPRLAPDGSPPATQALPDARLNAAAEPVRSQPEPPPAGGLTLSLDEAVARGLRDGQEVQLARTQVEIAETARSPPPAPKPCPRSTATPAIPGRSAPPSIRARASPFRTSSASLPDPTLAARRARDATWSRTRPTPASKASAACSATCRSDRRTPTPPASASRSCSTPAARSAPALRIADHVREAASLNLAEDAADVRRDVRTAYFQALLAQELAAIAEEGLAQADRVLEYEQTAPARPARSPASTCCAPRCRATTCGPQLVAGAQRPASWRCSI